MFAPGTSTNISEHFEHFTPFLEHSVQFITIAGLRQLKPINMVQLDTCVNNDNAIENSDYDYVYASNFRKNETRQNRSICSISTENPPSQPVLPATPL
jgi:hypothetical protein